MHRSSIAPLVILGAVLSSTVGFSEEYRSAYPYDVRVTAVNGVLRCGPGDEFYVTERIRQGTMLEVYRQVAGGWLAVRPTDASYSLVAARYVQETPAEDVVKVVDDHAVSWVGSTAGSKEQLRWQVRLDVGERVVVIGTETLRTFAGGPSELHYRIAPPSGEFRWIHQSHVRHASQLDRREEPLAPTTQLADFQVDAQRAEPPAATAQSAAAGDGFVARRPNDTKTAPISTASRREAPRPATLQPNDARPVNEAPAATADLHQEPLDDGAFTKRHRALDVELSLMVAQPVDQWRLASLKKQADELAVQGKTPVARGRAHLLAEKIAAFEALQSRYLSTDVDIVSGPDAPATRQASLRVESSGDDQVDPRFDGAGWLFPVHSKKQSSPPYALLDENGTILQFVSPAPGLNLHRYLKKEIGVFGQHTVGSQLDKPHVTAERVVSLDRHRR